MRHASAAAATLCLTAFVVLQAQDGPYHAGKEIPIGGATGNERPASAMTFFAAQVSAAVKSNVMKLTNRPVINEI